MDDFYHPRRLTCDKEPSDGIISKGTFIQVKLISTRVILSMTTENDERCSSLISRIVQQCATEEDVPRLCIKLCWEPPRPLRMSDESAGPAFSGKMKPLFMAASALISALQEEDFARVCSDADDHDTMDYCLVCLDPAVDIDLLNGNTDEYCVRCSPCSLCEKCKVSINGQSVCLSCIKCYEENLLDARKFRRKQLTTEQIPDDQDEELPKKGSDVVDCIAGDDDGAEPRGHGSSG